MIEDPQEHFSSKSLLARKEIEDDSPLVALRFTEKNRGGIVFITKSQNGNVKWKILNEENEEPIIIAGVGRYLDLVKFWGWLRGLIEDFINTYGPRDLNSPYLIKKITEYFDLIYTNESRALGIEILFFTSLLGELKMFRIKYDGDYHETNLYAIVGGRKKIDSKNPRTSIRRSVLRELGKAYLSKIPNFRNAQSLGRKMLSKDLKNGKMQTLRINFKLNKPA